MCPIGKNEALEDCYLELNKKETSSTIETYLSHNKKEILKNSDILPLSKELFTQKKEVWLIKGEMVEGVNHFATPASFYCHISAKLFYLFTFVPNN